MGISDIFSKSVTKKELKRLNKIVDKINTFEPTMKNLTDEDLKKKTLELKELYNSGQSLDNILPEAFALVREASIRTLGMRHYDVQLIGGIVLHEGRVAEMKTGEGKTLVATLAAYLNALSGEGVHIVTVNDYLADRDAHWMGKLYNFLGLSVGTIISDMDNDLRKKAYECDITYGTNNQFGFDYLRDNMVAHSSKIMQKVHNYAIIDEVDSILIDEARTPLIISGSSGKTVDGYIKADKFVSTLREEDYIYDEEHKRVMLSDESGVLKAEKFYGFENLTDPENMEDFHYIQQSLKARIDMNKDIDYVVEDGEVKIVDSFTGRIMNGRRYSNGLHQAIEAKERVHIKEESVTLATITLQNFFRMYNKLSGMTGTAKTEEEELKHIYNMDVVEIPTNLPIQRKDNSDILLLKVIDKYKYIVKDVKERAEKGQPVLIGTTSVETSELISKELKKEGIKHEVLNAKHHARESEIVAQAGRFGAITVATNMAGRGTDILLGGNPEFMAKKEMKKNNVPEELINEADTIYDTDNNEIIKAREEFKSLTEKYKVQTDKEKERVISVGGLYIIGTERHESRRIDNQLRGRSGRQGDVGESTFYLSTEDDILRIFGGERLNSMFEKIQDENGLVMNTGIFSRLIESAQKKVEANNFGIRKNVLKYDDVVNKQRTIIYEQRKDILLRDKVSEIIHEFICDVAESIVTEYTAFSTNPNEWDKNSLKERLEHVFLGFDFNSVDESIQNNPSKLIEAVIEKANVLYDMKEEELGADRLKEIEKAIVLKVVDTKWMTHIDDLDELRKQGQFIAIGQQDPYMNYQNESYNMFNELIYNIKVDAVRFIFGITLKTNIERKKVASGKNVKRDVLSSYNHAGDNNKREATVNTVNKGLNAPCPCGSGKKYKRCCGAKNK